MKFPDSIPHVNRSFRSLLLNDDVGSFWHLKEVLCKQFPGLEFESGRVTDLIGNFDVYFVCDVHQDTSQDPNRGDPGKLVRQIRAHHSDALVIAVSSTAFNPLTLKALVNAGCHGVYENATPEDTSSIIEIISDQLDHLDDAETTGRQYGSGVVGLIQSMRQLLRDWNRCLLRQKSLSDHQDYAEPLDRAA